MATPPDDGEQASEPQITPLHPPSHGNLSPTQTRDQRERENLFASIQSTNSWRRQPVDLDGSGASPPGPNGFYSKHAPHTTLAQSAAVGGTHQVNGRNVPGSGTGNVEPERPRDPRDGPVTGPHGVLTPLATSRPESPYTQHPTIDFDGLSWPSLGTRARKEESEEQRAERLTKLSGAVRTILECVGEDPDREGILDTPERYAKAMLFFTKGYEENLRDIVNGAVFHEDHDELVIVKDIEIFSLCEHHLVPFTGKMHIGYIPNRRVLGLSKVARIAEMFARRLQLQERLTKQVALALSEVLQPQGVAVVMESSHLCMVMRGVQKTGSSTVTSCMLGRMRSTAKTRQEFMNLLNRR